MPKNLVCAENGPIAKVRKIEEKNAAKGQVSLNTFFGSTQASGVKANKAAF
jgi:hypothetical protein